MKNIAKGIYQHYKGKRYEVIGQALHSEDLEPMVIYKALYKGDFPKGTMWVRPLTMFTEKVFVNKIKVARFRYISPIK